MKLIAPDPEVRIRMPYEYTAKALLTDTERRFYDCLASITDSRCRIQVKPRLANVFQHEKTNGAFQMISQKRRGAEAFWTAGTAGRSPTARGALESKARRLPHLPQ